MYIKPHFNIKFCSEKMMQHQSGSTKIKQTFHCSVPEKPMSFSNTTTYVSVPDSLAIVNAFESQYFIGSMQLTLIAISTAKYQNNKNYCQAKLALFGLHEGLTIAVTVPSRPGWTNRRKSVATCN